MKNFFKEIENKTLEYVSSNIPKLIILQSLIILIVMADQTGYLDFYFKLSLMDVTFFVWILAVVFLKVEGKVSIYLGIFFLVLSGLLFSVKFDGWAERTSSYAFLFLFFGVLQSLPGLIKKKSQN